MKNLFVYIISILILALWLEGCHTQSQVVRSRVNFDKDWKFHLGDIPDAQNPGYDDSSWRKLNLPHDWSIEGEFNKDNPATPGGGALPGGTGWYRKTFTTPGNLKDQVICIDFDGVYRNGEVWINGHYLGMRPYGYISFEYDLTPYLNPEGQTNTLAVKVDNSKQPNSRWYSGSGIYRNVWLVTTAKIHVDHWGTFVSTPEVSEQQAKLSLTVKVRNSSSKTVEIKVNNTVYDMEGNESGKFSSDPSEIKNDSAGIFHLSGQISSPKLWTLQNPYMYQVKTEVLAGDNVVDAYETSFGIRYFNFDVSKGFSLNGKPTKILGVCDHHDLGCLGAAINTRALERQLQILHDMGCNAIRTSHNPPAPELLDLCDRMGFIVMDEAFDMWKLQKTQYDYHLDWDNWHKRDLEDFILRDRNHPSVMLWSIGNEIIEQHDTSGIRIAKELAGIVRDLDTTRPITSALDDADTSNYIYKSGALDLVGFNYHEMNYEKFPKLFPGQKLFASETTSALATRGHYDMPSDKIRIWPVRWDRPFNEGNPEFTCSAYDNCHVPWGSTHEGTWKLIKKYDYAAGLFIWTGFDYLGEPTPYPWPARSSYFGIIDLAGFPKDAYYMYQSEWTQKPVLHIFPHWNWKKGESVDVWAYFNTDEVELFLNGKSLGTKHKTGDEIHVVWKVPFEPGTLKAIGRTGGKEIISQEVRTAGKPAKIVLKSDRNEIVADGTDLSFVTVEITDSAGTVVPSADNKINFEIKGNGSIAGVDNGNPVDHTPFKVNYRTALNGYCLAVVQANDVPGKIELTANSEGLEAATVEINTK